MEFQPRTVSQPNPAPQTEDYLSFILDPVPTQMMSQATLKDDSVETHEMRNLTFTA